MADEAVVVALVDRVVRVPRPLAPAVARLLDGQPHAAAELGDLDGASRLVLVRRLVREGVLRPQVVAAEATPA